VGGSILFGLVPKKLSPDETASRLLASPAFRLLAHPAQEVRPRKPVSRRNSGIDLKIVDRIARGLAEAAVDDPVIEPEPFEQALNLCLLCPAEKNLALRPMAAQSGFAVDPLGKKGKRESIGVGVIIYSFRTQ
jgi:hypothetical protein